MSIIIIGNTGTGKSTIGKILSLRTGFSLYEVGHVVKNLFMIELCAKASLERKNINQGLEFINETIRSHTKDYLTTLRLEYVNELIRKCGNDYFVRVLMKMIDDENTIIIGARSNAEINVLKTKFASPFFVGLVCDESKLIRRFVSREYEFMTSDAAKRIFERRINTEELWGVENILNMCNLVLKTDNIEPSDSALLILESYKRFIENTKLIQKGDRFYDAKIIY